MSTRQALTDSSKSSRYSVEASRTRLPASETWCSRPTLGCVNCPGISGGPSGIRTQDRRIKSQWLQLQNCRETVGKTQVSGHLPDT